MNSSNKIFAAISSEVNLRKSTNGWYRFTNPFDQKSLSKNDDTMAYNPTTGWVKCFRTGYSKSAIGFLMDLWNSDYRETLSEIQKFDDVYFERIKIHTSHVAHKIERPEYLTRIAFGNGLLAERARKYLTDRGFDIDVLDNMGFGFFDDGPYFGYIFIPYLQLNELVYWSSRSFLGFTPKYKNPPSELVKVGKSDLFFNEDALHTFDTVFVVEGVFDALSIGANAIASSGWSLSQVQIDKILRSRVKEVIFVPDANFYDKIKKESAKIVFHKKVKIVPTHTIDGWEDVNASGFDKVKELLPSLPVLQIQDLL